MEWKNLNPSPSPNPEPVPGTWYTTPVIRFILLLATIAPTCFAAQVIEPLPATIGQLQESIARDPVHATGETRGKGAKLKLTYASLAPIDTYILPLQEEGEINPRDILFVELPASEEGEAVIHLSSAPGWAWGDHWYQLHFLTEETELVPSVEIGLEGLPSPASSFRQFFTPEPFVPSSYHRLRGYRFAGLPFTLFSTILLLIFAGFFLWKKQLHTSLLILLFGVLLYNSRSSFDLLRYTSGHIREWTQEGTYGVAGSTYEIAQSIQERGIGSVRLCTDGTSYFSTLFKYAVYPTQVTNDANFVIVRESYEWSWNEGVLKCGDIDQFAIPLEEFNDGAVLFSLTQT